MCCSADEWIRLNQRGETAAKRWRGLGLMMSRLTVEVWCCGLERVDRKTLHTSHIRHTGTLNKRQRMRDNYKKVDCLRVCRRVRPRRRRRRLFDDDAKRSIAPRERAHSHSKHATHARNEAAHLKNIRVCICANTISHHTHTFYLQVHTTHYSTNIQRAGGFIYTDDNDDDDDDMFMNTHKFRALQVTF